MANKNNHSLKKQIGKNKSAYFLAAPFLLLFIAFTVFPLLMMIVLAFCDYDIGGSTKFVLFANFGSIFSFGESFAESFANSMLIFLCVGLGGFALCFFTAWGLEFLPKKAADIFTVTLFTFAFSGTIIAAVWLAGGLRAPLNSLLLSTGQSNVPASWLSDKRYAMLCTILSQLCTTFGLGFLALRSGFKNIPREYTDAAKIEGAKNPFCSLFYAQIPSIIPNITFAAAIQIGYSFSNSEILRILSGTSAEAFEARGILTYVFGCGANLDIGKACAANLILFALMSVIYAAVRYGMKKLSGNI